MTISTDSIEFELSFIPTDNSIGPKQVPKSTPAGYVLLPDNEKTTIIAQVARKLLGGEWGTITPFKIGNKRFLARVEPHYHNPPPPNTSTENLSKYPKPWGWHKGVTIYRAVGKDLPVTKEDNNFKLLEKIDKFYKEFGEN